MINNPNLGQRSRVNSDSCQQGNKHICMMHLNMMNIHLSESKNNNCAHIQAVTVNTNISRLIWAFTICINTFYFPRCPKRPDWTLTNTLWTYLKLLRINHKHTVFILFH